MGSRRCFQETVGTVADNHTAHRIPPLELKCGAIKVFETLYALQ
jgi:hypothetical protein